MGKRDGGEIAKSEKEEVEERKVAARIGLVQRSIGVSGVGDEGQLKRCTDV